jgi:hypothetical protein
MADEAFALSPISARASLPSEADYDAIREAFMETARGRWFLSEYTKRNRNADTNMVLDAVMRMEANLAAQKQAPAVISLIETLGAIRAAIRDAKVTAAEAMPRFDDDESLAAARNGARIIREIAWTLRECGADTRICDLLDTQVQAIEAGQQRIATGDGRAAVLASFDVLVQRIEQLATADAPRAASPAAEAEHPVAPAAEKAAASVTPLFRHAAEAPADILEAVMPAAAEAMPQDEIMDLAAEVTAASVEATSFAAEVGQPLGVNEPDLPTSAFEPAEAIAPDEFEAVISEAETAEDLAVLDIVAMEMAAPDLSEPEFAATVADEIEVAIAEMQAADAVEQLALQSAALAAAEIAVAAPELAPEAAPQPSLGAALIANGVIAHPAMPASDPLAPIRRMSQAEKIAFFS